MKGNWRRGEGRKRKKRRGGGKWHIKEEGKERTRETEKYSWGLQCSEGE